MCHCILCPQERAARELDEQRQGSAETLKRLEEKVRAAVDEKVRTNVCVHFLCLHPIRHSMQVSQVLVHGCIELTWVLVWCRISSLRTSPTSSKLLK